MKIFLKCSLFALMVVATTFTNAQAQVGGVIQLDDTRWISLGAGLRTSFTAIENGSPNGRDYAKDFEVENIRLYLNAQVFKGVTLEFNTERDATDTGDVRVLDAVGKIKLADWFQIWGGRHLPPSDRSNLNGPYFLNIWDFPFVQAYPAIFAGRDDGVSIWGIAFDGKFKYQFGVYDGTDSTIAGTTPMTTANQDDHPLFAGRLTYNFWDNEPEIYYNQSSYYGDIDVLALGVAAMVQEDGAGSPIRSEDYVGFNVDLLMEKKLGNNGVVTFEGAYYNYDLNGTAPIDTRGLAAGQSWFLLGSYLFPQRIGWGQFQPVIRYSEFEQDYIGDHERLDVGMNYIIDGHNARISLIYSLDDDPGRGINEANRLKLGLQLQLF